MDHRPWMDPQRFGSLAGGQRVMLVGWSAHREENEPDSEEWMRVMIMSLILGTWRPEYWRSRLFYDRLCAYFGHPRDHVGFWPKVGFLNFLPECVLGDERYTSGRAELRERARVRLRAIVAEHRPEKLFVFSSRRWEFPADAPLSELGPGFPEGASCFRRTKLAGADLYLLRHPQGARRPVMTETIARLLAA